jgi:transposase
VQAADRWHLMENASSAFLDAVRRSMREIRRLVGAMTINPDLPSAAERLQYEGYLRREDPNAAIMTIAKLGSSIREIVRRTSYSRGWCCQPKLCDADVAGLTSRYEEPLPLF